MIRIGCGAGFSSDRLGPAVDLARDGALDVLVFECIGERTMAFGHRDRRADPNRGYNPHLTRRLRSVLPFTHATRTQIVTNMGVANVPAAGEAALRVARELGLENLAIALVEGDDVTALLDPATPLADLGGRTIAEMQRGGHALVGANAYLGVEAILPALETEADVILTGRVADPSLFLAPILLRAGWALDDWTHLGRGTLVGHLLECGMQVTGGYFADPPFKEVPRLADCGYPIAEVEADGTATLTKLAGSGGLVSALTVKEQLLYEVHNPAGYLTPDVTADFSAVAIDDLGHDRVRVSGADGRERPENLKVTVGFDGGFLAEGGISYAGPGAGRRARLAADVLRERLDRLQAPYSSARIDVIGLASLHATALSGSHAVTTDSLDARVHVAMRTLEREAAETLLWEVEAMLCCGPAGGGGYRGQISPSVTTGSAFIPREAVRPARRVIRA